MSMDYKNNIEDQRNLLKTHLEEINIIVSEKLGIKVDLEIKEETNYKKQTVFSLIDDKNIKNKCGVMESAFENVYIEAFGVWWQEDGVVFELDFKYEHIDGGSNGAKFCTMQIKNNLLKLLE